MKCFYHNDHDGQAAAYAVYRKEGGGPEDYISMDYGKPFPIDDIGTDETIYIVDYSIQPEEMDKLLFISSRVTWIDHHKTAIEKYDGFCHSVPGVRHDGVAACELAWQFIHKTAVPEAILLIGDRDVWKWAYGDRTKYFCNGLAIYDTSPLSRWWDYILEDGSVNNVIAEGKLITKYKEMQSARLVADISFEATLDGHECVCLNAAKCSSETFGAAIHDYDICSSFYHNGSYYTISLYSEKIDVSRIAKSYGGGGHKGASGFQCNELPFKTKEG